MMTEELPTERSCDSGFGSASSENEDAAYDAVNGTDTTDGQFMSMLRECVGTRKPSKLKFGGKTANQDFWKAYIMTHKQTGPETEQRSGRYIHTIGWAIEDAPLYKIGLRRKSQLLTMAGKRVSDKSSEELIADFRMYCKHKQQLSFSWTNPDAPKDENNQPMCEFAMVRIEENQGKKDVRILKSSTGPCEQLLNLAASDSNTIHILSSLDHSGNVALLHYNTERYIACEDGTDCLTLSTKTEDPFTNQKCDFERLDCLAMAPKDVYPIALTLFGSKYKSSSQTRYLTCERQTRRVFLKKHEELDDVNQRAPLDDVPEETALRRIMVRDQAYAFKALNIPGDFYLGVNEQNMTVTLCQPINTQNLVEDSRIIFSMMSRGMVLAGEGYI